MEDKKVFFQGVSPKFTFTFGIMIGLSVISIVAFFVILFTDTCDGCTTATTNTNSAAAVVDDTAQDTTVDVSNLDITGAQVQGSGDIIIVEYSDFECSYCMSYHTTMEQIMEDYDGQVKWVWKHYPLSFHANAETAAEAAECAGEQNKFWEMAHELYANQTSLGESTYIELAGELGLNATTYNTCLLADKFGDVFASDLTEGTALGVQGTPGSIIYKEGASTGELVAGAYPYETVAAVIDSLL